MIERDTYRTLDDALLDELKKEYGDRVFVRKPFKVIRILYIRNGCCPDLPVLLTINPGKNGMTNYSCQCACDCWCTSGYMSAEEAIEEYKAMTAAEMWEEEVGK